MIRQVISATILGIAVSVMSFAAETDHTKDSLDAVKKNVDEKKAVLVDVREKSEWDAGHVEGAVSIPISELKDADKKQLEKKLPKDKIIYTHCAVGRRALNAANVLKDLGYDVRALKPGYKDLISSGFKKAEADAAKN